MRRFVGIVAALALLAACGGHDGNEEPTAPVDSPLPLPAAGGSRWAAIERDDDGDGLAELITRYDYDALGRRTLQTTWRAEDGILAGEPVEVQGWTYDSASRLLTHTVRDTRGERQTTATYGADGLLASTRLHWEGSTTARTTTFTWQNLRMVVTLTDDTQPLAERAFYGADGLVERIERRFGDYEEVDVDRYQWRPDTQLSGSSFSLAVGNLILHDLSYDADGRITRSTKTDDGIEDEMRRFVHDHRGRLLRVEVDSRPSSFADEDFAADLVYRIRWEAGLCQPTYRVERLLLQLQQAGVLGAQKAVLLGAFSDWRASPLDRGYTLKTVVQALRAVTDTPILTGLPFGHVPTKVCLPVGAPVTLAVQGRDAYLGW